MSFSTNSSRKSRFPFGDTGLNSGSEVMLNCNHGTKIRKENKGKFPLDIILEAIKAVKIHNLSIQQAAGFNMN